MPRARFNALLPRGTQLGDVIELSAETTAAIDAAARAHGVSACTDVTGFGLLGHLRNILCGSGLAARLDMRRLPALPRAVRNAR